MLSKLMKQVAIGALLIVVFVSISPEFQVLLSTVICLAACFAWYEALKRRELLWAGLFAGVAFLLNPFVPLPLHHGYALLLSFLGLSLFISSLVGSQQALLAPIPTNRAG
jgi:hypothetical protein